MDFKGFAPYINRERFEYLKDELGTIHAARQACREEARRQLQQVETVEEIKNFLDKLLFPDVAR